MNIPARTKTLNHRAEEAYRAWAGTLPKRKRDNLPPKVNPRTGLPWPSASRKPARKNGGRA